MCVSRGRGVGWSPRLIYRLQQVGVGALLVTFAAIYLLPLWWVTISSMRTPAEIYSANQSLLPTSLTLANYIEVLTETTFLRSIGNSAIVSLVVTAGGTSLALAAGYAFAKLEFADGTSSSTSS